ncbi:MAG: metallophosphoesterase family protein [Myxococcota bacterium]
MLTQVDQCGERDFLDLSSFVRYSLGVRTLAIGDIHGSRTALETLADYAQITPSDTLVTLGDYVDRGPDSRGVIEWLLEWDTVGRLVPLRGNHEIMFIDARDTPDACPGWLRVGGKATLGSYGIEGHQGFERVPAEHWEFIEQRCLPYFETEGHIFVHASVDAHTPMNAQSPTDLYWESIYRAAPHTSGKTVVCGHSSQRSGDPLDLGFAVCIDTYAYGGGWLTCLDVNSGKYWQASQTGQTRDGVLDMQLGRSLLRR